MRPPICPLCADDRVNTTLDGGEWLAFADYAALPDRMTGHPEGLEWFCLHHLPAARAQVQWPLARALQILLNGPQPSTAAR